MVRKSIAAALAARFLIVLVILASGSVCFLITLFAKQASGDALAHSARLSSLVRDRLELVRAPGPGSTPDKKALQQLVETLAVESGAGLTLILGDGTVLHAGEDDVLAFENLLRRREFQTALKDGAGHEIRPGGPAGRDLLYYARRLTGPFPGPAAVRLSLPIPVRSAPADWLLFGAFWLLLTGVGVYSFFRFTRRLKEPLSRLSTAFRELDSGTYTVLYAGASYREIRELVETANRVAQSLDARRNDALRRNDLKNSVLESMLEGVIALDLNNQILLMNQKACALFHLPPGKVTGKRIEELVTNANVLALIPDVMRAAGPVEDTFVIYETTEQYYHALGARLIDLEKKVYGVLIVLRDVTRLRQLE
ncbi:MAG TPA: PAS domain-containing protein, partial [Spirochaetia bacterium]|nr:PAS domain-containing protein [Spirochaetia bacterium]